MDFKFVHEQSRDDCKTQSELSWGRRAQKIEYDFGLKKSGDWSNLQVDLSGLCSHHAELKFCILNVVPAQCFSSRGVDPAPVKLENSLTNRNEILCLLQTMMTVKTPFDGFRVGAAELNYNLRQKQLKADAKVDYNSQVVALTFEGTADMRNHVVEGTVGINTPFRGALHT